MVFFPLAESHTYDTFFYRRRISDSHDSMLNIQRERENKNICTPSLTVSVHIGLETLGESACTALVPVGLVDGAAPFHGTLHLADVPSIAVYAPLEES